VQGWSGRWRRRPRQPSRAGGLAAARPNQPASRLQRQLLARRTARQARENGIADGWELGQGTDGVTIEGLNE
jgi:hypothetical protein